MPQPGPISARIVRFGIFELDLQAGELRRNGARVKLQEQPLQILQALLENPGRVVSRNDLRKRIWSADTFVDFDRGLYSALARLRDTLGDSAASPRFIETIPKKGYRFITPVEASSTPPADAPGSLGPTPPLETTPRPPQPVAPEKNRQDWLVVVVSIVIVAGLFAAFGSLILRRGRSFRAEAAQIRSLAVLPLENLKGDVSQDFLADGITEELITELGKSSALRVISRTSVMQYKGRKALLRDIARELNVDAVVEGTVERSGSRVRIRVRLIQATTDQLIWAQSYDREMRDTLLLQTDVARDIVGEIHASLTAEQNRLATMRQVDPEAFEDYLKGRYFSDKRSAAEFPRAIKYFQQAIARDPTYAAAYAGLADALVGEIYTGTPPDVVREKASWAALKAVQLDPSLSDGHYEYGIIREAYNWDWSGAEKEYLRAIDLNQNSAAAHQEYAVFLAFQGRFDESMAQAQRSQDLDPLSPFVRTAYCLDLYHARRYDQAIEKCQQALELDPDFFHAHENLADAYAAKGLYDRAFEEYQKTASVAGETSPRLAVLKEAFRRGGIRDFWRKQLELSETSTSLTPDATAIAALYSRLGDTTRAIGWLQRAYQARSPFIEDVKEDPRFDNLRSDRRLGDLLRGANLLQ